MEKLAFKTTNITNKNIEKILELLPNVATESSDENGTIKKAIDFAKLKQELQEYIVDGEESYDFTWVGKKESIIEANKPITKTLRPDRESSIDWENTKNIYIEGDNLEALKLLQESYLGKVKMIYIDPPYNTGKDFVYKDNFTLDKESYEEEIGLRDEYDNKLFLNTQSNGRFHSTWCSMIYPRLKLARNLLSDDGVIFISIDDNEVDNLKKICDEVFGEGNFVACMPRLTSAQRPSQEKYISKTNDYIIIYVKNRISDFNPVVSRNLQNIKQDANGKYCEGDSSPILASATQGYSKGGDYDFEYNGRIYKPEDSTGNRRRWLWTIDRMKAAAELNILIETKNTLRVQNYINKEFQVGTNKLVDKSEKLILCSSDLMSPEYANSHGTQIINDLFKKRIFDFAKPLSLLEIIARLPKENSIILDFFSGSATTAHAVMKLNAEDGGNRKFIMVQLPESIDEKSEAYKAGYKNICEIGKERIRRAGKRILEEIDCHEAKASRNDKESNRHCERSEAIQNNDEIALSATHSCNDKLDIGFRVFKIDDTNMKDVYYSPKEYDQNLLDKLESNIKEDRSDEDLLYGILLDWGVELSLPHKVESFDNKRIHIVNDDDLIACFEDNISLDLVKHIAKLKPTRAVFKDSSFNTDDNKINVEEIFKQISPDTTIKVI